jgi:hypothetical protein
MMIIIITIIMLEITIICNIFATESNKVILIPAVFGPMTVYVHKPRTITHELSGTLLLYYTRILFKYRILKYKICST